nr:hypothetical protein [Halomarina salina]
MDLDTDPTEADTDGDGLDDAAELDGPTDPTRADTDNDGLDDGAEQAAGSDPTVADTDEDGLTDGREADLGTDPTATDTDGDGFGDGEEVLEEERLPDADPLRKDVYVEVDYQAGATISDEERHRIVESYADAPVSNPSGERGIALHLVVDEQVGGDSPVYWNGRRGDWNDLGDFYYDRFDNYGAGYHYAVVVDELDDDRTIGLGAEGVMLVEDHPRAETGSTLMHELGHSLGIGSDTFTGVDSRERSVAEYPSVMNYNADNDFYGYSDGSSGDGDFDDWGYIEEHLDTPPTYDRSG